MALRPRADAHSYTIFSDSTGDPLGNVQCKLGALLGTSTIGIISLITITLQELVYQVTVCSMYFDACGMDISGI